MATVGPAELLIVMAIAVLVLAIPVALLFLVVRAATRSALRADARVGAVQGVGALDSRLRRGEITPEEYAQARRALGA